MVSRVDMTGLALVDSLRLAVGKTVTLARRREAEVSVVCARHSSRVALCGTGMGYEREFVTGNEIPRIVAHRCVIEASIDVIWVAAGRYG
jgi:hypothetical protein